MFKITRKTSPNFEEGKSCCVKGGANRNPKNFGSGWAVSVARRMRLGWFLLILLCPAFAEAQVSELWVARYHGPVDGSSDAAVAMALDSAGNVCVTGRSQGSGTGVDYATVAYDPKGNQLWAARYNGPGNGDDIVNGIAVDSKAGHVYVTGQSQGTGTGSDYATVAYDFKGNQLWVARYNGPVGGIFGADASIAVDSKTDNVYVAGETTPASTSWPRITTIAYDSNGNQLWAVLDQDRNVLQGAPYSTFAHAIVVDSALGHAYVTGGVALIRDGTVEARTVAYDSAGDPLWGADENGPPGYCEDQWGVAIALGRDGNVFLTAHCLYGFNAGHAYSTLGYDPTGKRLWSVPYQTFPGSEAEASSIATDNTTGNVFVTGREQTTPSGETDYTTVAYDSGGNHLWAATYGITSSSGRARANAIAVDSTGNVYVTGQSQGDYATVAYDSKGNQLWAARHSTGTANAIAVDSNTGNVYLTGQGQGTGTGTDFTTIAYSQDTTPPVTTATASPDPNANGWNNTNVTVSLNSTDSESGGSGAKQIQYALSGAQSVDTQTVPGSTASAVISAEGFTTLTYFGTDNAGNAERSKALTVQIDKTPPVVSGMPSSACTLWPPNNQMVQIATITAADALSGLAPGSFQMTGSSNEPSDPSKPDVVLTPNGSGGYVIQLRARRLGSGTGRIYTLQATVTDLAGNTVTSTSTCTVPRDASTAKAH